MTPTPQPNGGSLPKNWLLATINPAGAFLSAVWLLYLVYQNGGFWHTVLAFVIQAFVLRIGSAPLFAFASSILCFHYSVVGIWLPILSYCTAGIALALDIRTAKRLNALEASIIEEIKNDPVIMGAGNITWTKESIEEFNRQIWAEELAGLVDELGAEDSELEICVYPKQSFGINAAPLFRTHSTDLNTCMSRLRNEFGGGEFSFAIFVQGKLRRRFSMTVPLENDADTSHRPTTTK